MSKLAIFLPDVGEVVHELTEAKVSVGRTEENAIHINDASVSTRHAEFVLSGGEYVLRDLGSTNGSRINGKSVTEAKLTPGDRIRFGSIEGVFEPDARKAPQPLPPGENVHAMPSGQSHRPQDFGNASPFVRKAAKADPVKQAAIAAGILALLICLAVIYYAYTLQAPQIPPL